MPIVRDQLWLWGHEAGIHSGKQWGIDAPSRITPTEACHHMGIPNCVMVVYANQPAPPFGQYALPMTTLDKVVWSVVGDAGSTRNDSESDLDAVLSLAERYPNLVGGMMDDFFRGSETPRWPIEAIREFRHRLHTAVRPLDLWVVLYHHELDLAVDEYLDACDVITLWSMKDEELARLETTLSRLVERTPGKRRVLGIYLWNYGSRKPMAVDLVQRQCELGLNALKQGEIDGIIFLASCICDLGLEAVEWVRNWVAQVGDDSLGPSPA